MGKPLPTFQHLCCQTTSECGVSIVWLTAVFPTNDHEMAQRGQPLAVWVGLVYNARGGGTRLRAVGFADAYHHLESADGIQDSAGRCSQFVFTTGWPAGTSR